MGNSEVIPGQKSASGNLFSPSGQPARTPRSFRGDFGPSVTAPGSCRTLSNTQNSSRFSFDSPASAENSDASWPVAPQRPPTRAHWDIPKRSAYDSEILQSQK